MNNILSQLLNSTLLMSHEGAQALFNSLRGQLDKDLKIVGANGQELSAEKPSIVCNQTLMSYGLSAAQDKPYGFIDGVAVIPVTGALIHGYNYSSRYATGYEAILSMYKAAMDDPDVKGVLFVFNTPGGTVAGCFDLVDYIYETRDQKPVWGIANEMACSAGQALFSACSKRFVTQTAITGSVGVVRSHANYEKLMAEWGVEMTLMFSGDHKVDGNPYKALPKEVFERFTAECDDLREMFATTVSRNTGMTTEQVLATEALCYTGESAIEVGLAHELINAHHIFEKFNNHLSTQDTNHVFGANMSKENETPEAGKDPQATTAQAKSDERQRIAGIQGCTEAEGRQSLANHLAMNTDMSVEDAKLTLAASLQEPKKTDEGASQATVPDDLLSAAMNNTEQPNIAGGEQAGQQAQENEASMVDQACSAFTQATGEKLGA